MRLFKVCVLFLIVFESCKTEEKILVKENPPIVLTMAASQITLMNATLNGEVAEEGFAPVTDRGFVYSDKNTNPSFNDIKLQSGSGKGIYSIGLDKLTINTKYYLKAYAINTKGIAYGSIVNFTTGDYSLSSLNTLTPENILYTSVDLKGIVKNDGGSVVTERGFCLSQKPSPTINDLKIIVGSGLGNFNYKVDKLNDDSKYYVRTYAINVKGVAYGDEMNFVTKKQTVPNVSVLNVVSVNYFNCILNFGFHDAGGNQITGYGICISENPNPTILDTKQNAGLYSSNIVYSEPPKQHQFTFNNLKIGTTYHARAYAQNGKGIGYSTDYEFKTDSRDPLIGQNLYGGVVAYVFKNGDPGYNPNVKHGLISAPVSDVGILTGTFPFSQTFKGYADNTCYCTLDNSISTGTKIGDGKSNTNLLYSTPCKKLITPSFVSETSKGTNTAIGIAYNITINGYDDWFIPSLDELSAMYKNRDILKNMNDTGIKYWTSSYCGTNLAYAIQFANYPDKPNGLYCLDVLIGSSASGGGNYRFRPIRYF
jgi:hypothetical protein